MKFFTIDSYIWVIVGEIYFVIHEQTFHFP